MGLVQRDLHALDAISALAKFAISDCSGNRVEDITRHELGGGVVPLESRHVIEILKVDGPEYAMKCLRRAPDVHDDPVGIQFRPPELEIDDIGRAMQTLGRTENGPVETVGDHEVIANK